MKCRKYLIPFFVVAAVLLSACGRKKDSERSEENIPKAVMQPNTQTEENEEELAPAVISYTVQLSDKILSLYEVNGDRKKLITSIEINPESYPKEDIEKLKKGMEAYCKEEGYEILENFAN